MSEHNAAADPAASVIDALGVAWRLGQQGVAAPPIPKEFEVTLRAYGDWCFATFEPPMAPSEIAREIVPRVDEPGDNFLIIAIDGFGLNSWAFHYILNLDGLTCILQKPCGGAFDDTDDNLVEISKTLAHIGELIDRPIASGERLIVIDTFYESGWSRTIDGEVLEQEESVDPFRDAATAVHAPDTVWRMV
ncbi:MAG: hypothetical protein AAGC81_19270 [Pseudomonadota bacterium]